MIYNNVFTYSKTLYSKHIIFFRVCSLTVSLNTASCDI